MAEPTPAAAPAAASAPAPAKTDDKGSKGAAPAPKKGPGAGSIALGVFAIGLLINLGAASGTGNSFVSLMTSFSTGLRVLTSALVMPTLLGTGVYFLVNYIKKKVK